MAKAMIQNGKIYNFVDDGYIAGNKEIDGGTHPTIKLVLIKGFSPDVDMEQIKLNATREKGVFKYYLDDKGIVQQLDITTTPEFEAYQQRMRQAEYTAKTDGIFFKEQRGEVPAGTWEKAVAEIKAKIY